MARGPYKRRTATGNGPCERFIGSLSRIDTSPSERDQLSPEITLLSRHEGRVGASGRSADEKKWIPQ
ncbi:hypothetical protein AKJ09_01673 [Labilithrix luteola]|uniref:Uncharacterized protein n=1 Tax=Labilithrix luteola TaxID=1391654 RepID=A0A0K1PPG3_9BACT|nr:hypothetical protein AKJ09_01673 [Labilithrix luteola]